MLCHSLLTNTGIPKKSFLNVHPEPSLCQCKAITSCHIQSESRQRNYSPFLCSSLEPCLDLPSLCWTASPQLFLSGNFYTLQEIPVDLPWIIPSPSMHPFIHRILAKLSPPLCGEEGIFLVSLFTHPSVAFAFLFCNGTILTHIQHVIDCITPAAFSEDLKHLHDETNLSFQLAISSFQAAPEDLWDKSALLVSYVASCTRDFTVSSHFCVTAQLTVI